MVRSQSAVRILVLCGLLLLMGCGGSPGPQVSGTKSNGATAVTPNGAASGELTPTKASGTNANPPSHGQICPVWGCGMPSLPVYVMPPAVTISISPTSASVLAGGTQQFGATVTNTSNTAVTWSATAGGVSSAGLYTAPATAGTYTVTATSVADNTKSVSATVTVTTATTTDVLIGNQGVELQTDSTPAGEAEAFQATALANGTLKSLIVYLDASSTAAQLIAGIYTDAGGRPGTLLNQASNVQLRAGAWNTVTLPATNVAAGTQYWIAILGAASGSLAYRDARGSCASQTSSQTTLASLPSSWTSGSSSSYCPASIYGSSSNVIFFDNFPGTSLSPFWTIISRHGEYSQNETECNIPQQVAVSNGLTITTAAQSWTCGDFNPNGTVWHTPSSWPYITGDIQWANLKFTYGTVEIRAKFPDQRTSLWPATWLLTANCQATNPLTGETGVGSCPNLGSSGYTEIDMTECYISGGWCQFHIANPSFGIGNGCDGSYTVDTNYHTFTTVWTSSGITQYMDGVSETTCGQHMNSPMFLIIQTQTGGAGGTPNNAYLPATFMVEYVKVTQP